MSDFQVPSTSFSSKTFFVVRITRPEDCSREFIQESRASTKICCCEKYIESLKFRYESHSRQLAEGRAAHEVDEKVLSGSQGRRLMHPLRR